MAHAGTDQAREILFTWVERLVEERAREGLLPLEGLVVYLDAFTAALHEPTDEADAHHLAAARRIAKQELRRGVPIGEVLAIFQELEVLALERWPEIGPRVVRTGAAAVREAARCREEFHLERRERNIAQLLALMDDAPVDIFVKDREGRYIEANRHFTAFLGRPKSEVIGKTDYELFPEEIAMPLRRDDRKVIDGGEAIEVYEDLESAGTLREMLSVKFPYRDANGEILAVVGISADVTESRRREGALRRSHELFRGLGEAVTDYVILTMDPEGRIDWANEGAQRIEGWTRDELVGRHYRMLFADEDAQAGEPERALAVARTTGRYHTEALRRRKDGSQFWAEVTLTPLLDAHGRLLGYAKIARDVTRRKRLEQQRDLLIQAGQATGGALDLQARMDGLAAVAAQYLADYCAVYLFESGEIRRRAARARDPMKQYVLDDVLALEPPVDPHGYYGFLIEAGEPMADQDVGPAMLDAIARGERHRRALEELGLRSTLLVPMDIGSEQVGSLLLAWRQPGMATPEAVELGRALALRAATALANARLYEETKEAVRLREEVVAVVSHDLRNPLSAILMGAKALLDSGTLDDRQRSGLTRIRNAAARAERLAREVLEFSRVRAQPLALSRVRLDLHAVVRDVCDEIAVAHPQRDIEVISQGAGTRYADAARLAQLVSNLVGNAVQHGPAGTPVRVESSAHDDTVELRVHNEGEPIEQELLPVLFEPFRRGAAAGRAKGSLGLGLYIAAQVVRAHEGTIEVESTAETGTTFIVRLPRRLPT